jgi:hypothetical protein
MSNTLDSFKRTLSSIPKLGHGPNFNANAVYNKFLVTESSYVTERYIGSKLEETLYSFGAKQEQYNGVMDKLKEFYNLADAKVGTA